jgi:DnaJ-class molecular chaperone
MVGTMSEKITLDDLTLAFETLSNESSKAEYDLYLKSSGKQEQNYWNWEPGSTEKEEPEEKTTRKSSKLNSHFINDEFINNW